MTTVELRRLTTGDLPALSRIAVADATPDEVMPPVDGPPGWTPARVAAFTDFQHTRLTEPGRRSYLITADGEPAGVIRLDDTGPHTAETGYWIARSHRRKGVATAAVALILTEARTLGLTGVTAETTLDNPGSRAALARNGADCTVDGPGVRAAFRL
ncbi:GNAT family N-acetyltransferase [Phytomonospora endophytica]|uniref:RimJ/RimL family protein N-acetyltransferase n=1 Tax=Phytomonospora endophytica TaxID=714109 RepID=A0A841FL69_9ACTN|nr:GNAT family N-acetyltransferase [Phytomonospora endophytica]MBB6036675.1 RimJ/RimL family protein N-acetyltransferase [Phytomonospora endophytica]GIG65997.1 hypothetical protein Pen01_22920 [Phytomonospora endophytica]